MKTEMIDTVLIENIKNTYRRMSHAAMRVERNPEGVKLVAVTKNIGVKRIKEAIDWGLRIFGEDRVQEAKEKIEELSCFTNDFLRFTPISWHLVGHLQKNKAKIAVKLFDLVQSLDSVELANELNKHDEKAEMVRPFFRELRELRDSIVRSGYKLPELSMGMTHDFEVAIEEGATMVRIGTGIFGER